MTPYITNPWAWQESWDRQQEAYLPDREHRLAAVLDTVDAVLDPVDAGTGAPRVLDLAGGTGSIGLRALARFPRAEVTLLDIDPVLLAIAAASLGERATIVTADLGDPGWRAVLPHRRYDAVLTATALHWLPADRLAALYAEIRDVLRPGGVFVNADHMPDDRLPTLSERFDARVAARREARAAAGGVLPWGAWWDHVARDPDLGPLASKRAEIYPSGHSAEWNPPVSWHLDALKAAGYAEAGTVWRGATDAAVAALR